MVAARVTPAEQAAFGEAQAHRLPNAVGRGHEDVSGAGAVAIEDFAGRRPPPAARAGFEAFSQGSIAPSARAGSIHVESMPFSLAEIGLVASLARLRLTYEDAAAARRPAVADSLDFEQKYTSVVIAWAPDDRPTDAQIGAVLDEFAKTAWAGLRATIRH